MWLLILLILTVPCMADTFERVSDTQVTRKTEKVEDVNILSSQCQQIKLNLDRTMQQCQRALDEYNEQISACKSDLDKIKVDTGVEVIPVETADPAEVNP